jgi:TP901 family phage tail tape measure protein
MANGIKFDIIYQQNEQSIKKIEKWVSDIKKELSDFKIDFVDTKNIKETINAQKEIIKNNQKIIEQKKQQQDTEKNNNYEKYIRQQNMLFNLYTKAVKVGAKDTINAIKEVYKTKNILSSKEIANIRLVYSEEKSMLDKIVKDIKTKFTHEVQLIKERQAEKKINDIIYSQKVRLKNIYDDLRKKDKKELDILKNKLSQSKQLTKVELSRLQILERAAKINRVMYTVGGAIAYKAYGFASSQIDELGDMDKSFFDLGVVAGKSTSEIRKMRKEFFDLSREIPITAQAMADATNSIARTGMSFDDSFKTMEAAAKLSVASGEDLAFTSQMLAKQLVAFKLSGEEAAETIDSIHSIALTTPTSLQGINDTLKSSAAAFGVLISMTDKSGDSLTNYKKQLVDLNLAMTGTLAQIGLKASTAGIVIRNFMTRILSTEKNAIKMFNSLNISFRKSTEDLSNFSSNFEKLSYLAKTDVYQALNVLSDNLGELTKNIDGGGNALQKMFTVRQWSAVFNILDQIKQYGNAEIYVESMNNAKKVSDDFNTQLDALNNKLQTFKNNMQTLKGALIDSGSTLMDLFKFGLSPVTEFLAEMSDSVLSTAMNVGILVVSIGVLSHAIFNFITKSSLMASVLTIFSNPSVLGIIGIITVLTTIWSLYKQHQKTLEENIKIIEKARITEEEINSSLEKRKKLLNSSLSITNQYRLALSDEYNTVMDTNKKYKERLDLLKSQLDVVNKISNALNIANNIKNLDFNIKDFTGYNRENIADVVTKIDILTRVGEYIDYEYDNRSIAEKIIDILTPNRNNRVGEYIDDEYDNRSIAEKILKSKDRKNTIGYINELLGAIDEDIIKKYDFLKNMKNTIKDFDDGLIRESELQKQISYFKKAIADNKKNKEFEAAISEARMKQQEELKRLEEERIQKIEEENKRIQENFEKLKQGITEIETATIELKGERFRNTIDNKDKFVVADIYKEIFGTAEEFNSKMTTLKGVFKSLKISEDIINNKEVAKNLPDIFSITDTIQSLKNNTEFDEEQRKSAEIYVTKLGEFLKELIYSLDKNTEVVKSNTTQFSRKAFSETYMYAKKRYENSNLTGIALLEAKAGELEAKKSTVENTLKSIIGDTTTTDLNEVIGLIKNLKAEKTKLESSLNVDENGYMTGTKEQKQTYENIVKQLEAYDKYLNDIYDINIEISDNEKNILDYKNRIKEKQFEILKIGLSDIELAKLNLKNAQSKLINKKDELEVATKGLEVAKAQYEYDKLVEERRKRILDYYQSISEIGKTDLELARLKVENLEIELSKTKDMEESARVRYELEKARYDLLQKENSIKQGVIGTSLNTGINLLTGNLNYPSFDMTKLINNAFIAMDKNKSSKERSVADNIASGETINMFISTYAKMLENSLKSQEELVNTEIQTLELRQTLAKTEEERIELERQMLEKQIELIQLQSQAQQTNAIAGGITGGVSSGISVASGLSQLGMGAMAGPVGLAMAGFSIFSGLLGASDAQRQAKLQEQLLREQQETREAIEQQNKYTKTSNEFLKDLVDNAGTLGYKKSMDIATKNVVDSYGKLGGSGSVTWTSRKSVGGIAGFFGKKKTVSHVTSEYVDLESLGIKNISSYEDLIKAKERVNVFKEQTKRTINNLSKHVFGEALSRNHKAKLKAIESLEEQIDNIINTINKLNELTSKQRLGATLEEVFAEDGKTITGYKANWEDFLTKVVESTYDVGAKAGDTFVKTFMSAINSKIGTSKYESALDNLENRMNKLSETLNNTSGSYNNYTSEALSILKEQEVIYKNINEEMFKVAQSWVSVGGNLSDIKSQLTDIGQSVYDGVYSSLSILDDEERFSNIGKSIGESIINGIQESQLNKYFSDDILGVTQKLTNMINNNDFSINGIYSLAQESQRLTANTLATASKLSSISDLFDNTNIDYTSSTSEIQYQTATTSEQVYNYYNTVNVDIGNLLNAGESEAREFAHYIYPYIKEVSKEFYGG